MELRSKGEKEMRCVVKEEATNPMDDGGDKGLCPAHSVCINYNLSAQEVR